MRKQRPRGVGNLLLGNQVGRSETGTEVWFWSPRFSMWIYGYSFLSSYDRPVSRQVVLPTFHLIWYLIKPTATDILKSFPLYPTAIKRKNKLILLLRNYWADMFWLFSIFKRYRNVNILFDPAISPPWGTMSEKRIRKFVGFFFPRSQIFWMRHLKNNRSAAH